MKGLTRNLVPLLALLLTTAVAVWGIVDTDGLAGLAERHVALVFRSRGWFVMLTTSILLITAVALALSRYGRLRLGGDDDRPEFSTPSWLTMMFAAGMGVGLLFYGTAEPVTHFLFLRQEFDPARASDGALFITDFHWGLHAWAIYGMTGMVIAYFSFRWGGPQLVGAPLAQVYGANRWTRGAGGVIDLLSIYATAIGLAGSVAMGVFQVSDGLAGMLGMEPGGMGLALAVFAVLFAAYMFPLTVDLSRGMALLSNTAIAITIGLMVYILLVGPTGTLMGSIVDSIGNYLSRVAHQGFRTYAFFDRSVEGWFAEWTLNYMVWWLAWSPFVGVFIARISRGRTIREFVAGVLLVPTAFSIFWFGVLGSAGFFQGRAGRLDLEVVSEDVNRATFLLLDNFPLSPLTTIATIVAALLFIITSVVSAAYVLAMFSSHGDTNPRVRVKLTWGVILGVLGLAMILSESAEAVRQIIALSAGPFVFIVLLLLVTFLRALRQEPPRRAE
ncbi:BCCT family transporter [Thiohalorhabdus sp. Cl-TMA]|uniref:BCCT family transporter n=1 Tax=Thiohalorhabdus methylotrophus TaxID=3242694 RepID=A0ABV4TTR9_9GAMM